MAEVTLEQVPQKVRDLFNRGFSAMERGNLDYAIDMLTACLELEPLFHQARRYLRAAEIKRFKMAGGGAFTHLMSTITGFPAVATAQAMVNAGKPMQAIGAIEKVLRKDPLNLFYIKVLAKAAEAAGEPDIAIQTLAMIREHQPHDIFVLNLLGRLYMKTEQPRLARQCFETLCEIKPNDTAALKALKDAMATDSMTTDGWAKAAASGKGFRTMIRDEKQATILEQESKSVKGQQDVDALIAENKARVLREPGNINYRRALAQLYAGSQMFEEAILTLQEALAVANGRDPHLEQAITQVRLQAFEHEIKRLRGSDMTAAAEEKEKERDQFLFNDVQDRAARYPNDLQIKYEYGILLFQQNRINDAIQQFQAAQRNAQRRTSSLYYIGLCFKAKQQYDMAIEQLGKALEELPVMDEQKKAVLYELGQILESSGRMPEAIDHYKQIYQIDIGYRDVAAKVERGYAKPA
jgi:tetratricopeptide (TPR) repeat protein